MQLIRKTFDVELKQVQKEEGIIQAVLSSGQPDRDGEIIDQSSWNLEEYKKNPVVLWSHDPVQPAIGQMVDIFINQDGMLEGIIKFAIKEYDFAKTIFQLYAGKFLRAFSVGFTAEEEEDVNGIRVLKNNTLYEVSAVNIPADALALAKSKGLDISPLEYKGVIPYKETPTASEDEEWDAGKEVAEADVEDLKIMCAWYDSENPDVKSSYKLPHHKAKPPYKVVWRGVAAAMGALMGARGGVKIPEKDVQGVYNHLVKHYKQFDKEPPELKRYNIPDTTKSPACRLNNETQEEYVARKIPEILKENPGMEQSQATAIAYALCSKKCGEKDTGKMVDDDINNFIQKEGRILSTKNRSILEKARDAIIEVLKADEESRANREPVEGLKRQKFNKIVNKAVRELLEAKKKVYVKK